MVAANGKTDGKSKTAGRAVKTAAGRTAVARAGTGKGAPARTLGPVSDLERHLPSEWWRTLFNALYLKTDGDVVEKDENTVEDVNALVDALDLKPEDGILDLCCGHGRHSLELARRGFQNITGIDRSRYLIRFAR